MAFKDQLDELNEKLQDFVEQAKSYFSDLDEKEKYGWAAEGAGAVMFIVGMVLLVI